MEIEYIWYNIWQPINSTSVCSVRLLIREIRHVLYKYRMRDHSKPALPSNAPFPWLIVSIHLFQHRSHYSPARDWNLCAFTGLTCYFGLFLCGCAIFFFILFFLLHDFIIVFFCLFYACSAGFAQQLTASDTIKSTLCSRHSTRSPVCFHLIFKRCGCNIWLRPSNFVMNQRFKLV